MKALERLFRYRPRIFNMLHSIHLVRATSQTNEMELTALAKFASGARTAVEIGSFQGVSAAVIATNMVDGGCLFCVDPWPSSEGDSNPIFDVFRRHIERENVADRIRVTRALSSEATDSIPTCLDFAFIDGDHSWTGIEVDWAIIAIRIRSGGIVCLHDTAVPAPEPWRKFESCDFYDARIKADHRFELVETVYSMRVLRRR